MHSKDFLSPSAAGIGAAAFPARVYRNPTPVVVLLVPIKFDGEIGLLAVRRSLQDGFGKLALPGGYQIEGEPWKEAGARELREEATVKLADSSKTRIVEVLDSTGCKHILIFGVTEPIRSEDLPSFVPNNEVSERVVLKAPVELAFPAHTEMARRFFAEIAPLLK